VVLQLVNLGSGNAEGGASPIVITDTLPAGIEATAVSGGAECGLVSVRFVRCEYHGGLIPFSGQIEVEIAVKVSGAVSGALVNEADAGGGGATSAWASESVTVSGAPATNGLEKLQNGFTNEDGSPDTLAGSHPFQMNTTIVPNTANTKDIHILLPPGFVANTNVLAQCTTAEFDAILLKKVNTGEYPRDHRHRGSYRQGLRGGRERQQHPAAPWPARGAGHDLGYTRGPGA
jgi:hypothetical protein